MYNQASHYPINAPVVQVTVLPVQHLAFCNQCMMTPANYVPGDLLGSGLEAVPLINLNALCYVCQLCSWQSDSQ